jgi:hypothetical protein
MAEVFKPSRGGQANFNLGRVNPNIAMGMARAAEATHRQVLGLVDKNIEAVEEHTKQVDSENTIVNLEKLDARMLELAEEKFTSGPDPSNNLSMVERINSAFTDEIANMVAGKMTSGARKLFRIGAGRNKAAAMNLVIQRDLSNKRIERNNKIGLAFKQAGQSAFAFAKLNPHLATDRILEKFRQQQDILYQANYAAATMEKFQDLIRSGIEEGFNGLLISDPRRALADLDSGIYNDYTVGEEERVYWGLSATQQDRLRAEAEAAITKLNTSETANYWHILKGRVHQILNQDDLQLLDTGTPLSDFSMPIAPNPNAKIRGDYMVQAARDMQYLSMNLVNLSAGAVQSRIDEWQEHIRNFGTDPIYASVAAPILDMIIVKNSKFRAAYDKDALGAGQAYSSTLRDALEGLPWFTDRYQTISQLYQDTMGVKRFKQRLTDNATVTTIGDQLGLQLKQLPQHMGLELNQLSSQQIWKTVAEIAQEAGPERMTRLWSEIALHSKEHNFTASQIWAFNSWQNKVKFHHLLGISKTNEAKLNDMIGSDVATLLNADDLRIEDSGKVAAFLSSIPDIEARARYAHLISMVAKSMAAKNQDYNAKSAIKSAVDLLFGDQKVMTIPLRTGKDRTILLPNTVSDADIENATEQLHNFITFELLDAMPSEGGQDPKGTMENYVNQTFLLYNGRSNGWNIAYQGPFGPILVRDVNGDPILKDFNWFAKLQTPLSDNAMANRKGATITAFRHFYTGLTNLPFPFGGGGGVFKPALDILEQQQLLERKKRIQDDQERVKKHRKRVGDANTHIQKHGTLAGTIFDMPQEEFMKLTNLSVDKTAVLYRVAQDYISAWKLHQKAMIKYKSDLAIFNQLKKQRVKNKSTLPQVAPNNPEDSDKSTFPQIKPNSPKQKMNNLSPKLAAEANNVPIQTDGSGDTTPGKSIATVYKPMWNPTPKLKVVPKVSVGPSTLPKGWVGADIKKKEPKKEPKKVLSDKGDLEGKFKSPNPSKLPTTGLDKLSLAKLKKYTKETANGLGTEDRKTLRDLLKKKGASRKFIAEVFGFGN